MSRSVAWKRFERSVCRALGGERRGPTGVSVSDCVDVPLSVSCKLTKRGTPEGAHILEARALGKRDELPWWLVTGKANSPRCLVTMDFAHAVMLARAAGIIAGSDGRDPLAEEQDSSTLATPIRLSTSSDTSAE